MVNVGRIQIMAASVKVIEVIVVNAKYRVRSRAERNFDGSITSLPTFDSQFSFSADRIKRR